MSKAHVRSNVLDVVRAVTQIVDRYPDVTVWWYVPRLLENPNVELLLELEPGRRPEFTQIARDVEQRLINARVTVREHPGGGEDRRLFRIYTKSRHSAPA